MNWVFLIFLACSAHAPSGTDGADIAKIGAPLAMVTPVDQVFSMQCDVGSCTINGAGGVYRYTIEDSRLAPTEDVPTPIIEPWPVASTEQSLGEQWNKQVDNRWRSPFRTEIPVPDGGHLRSVRGLTPGTSRVIRIGGSVITARQGLDPGDIAYPNALALHPTGAEAYLIVWPNPELIAFRAQTLKTTWRIVLGAPAQGLFVSEDGRYLLAETDGIAPEHQLLDYEPTLRTPPEGIDPAADAALAWLERPEAAGTIVVDLTIGEVVARLPGRAIGFFLLGDGAVVSSSGGVATIRRPTGE